MIITSAPIVERTSPLTTGKTEMITPTYDETKWKLVPVEPTQEMLNCTDANKQKYTSIYKTMLSAAPQPPEAQPEQQKPSTAQEKSCETCPDCKKPTKEQPLFMQGYDAGLADGKRIAQREQVPVAFMYTDSGGEHYTDDRNEIWNGVGIESWTPLYAAPAPQSPSKAQTPLTGEQLLDIARGYKANDQHRMRDHWDLFVSFARAVEAAHGITGETK